MTKFVALLRGINVGGHRKIKMVELKEAVASCGFTDVQHYVQSGNLVFTGEGTPEGVADRLEAVCAKAFGFDLDIMVMDGAAFAEEVAACPFADGDSPAGGREAKLLHLGFCKAIPDRAHVERVLAGYVGPEEIALKSRTLHIYYTEGSGRSKLTPLLTEKRLGMPITARNWNTVQKLLLMLAE